MNRNLIVLISVVLLGFAIYPVACFAQRADSIRTGRPGQSIGPYSVGNQMLQFQSGYQLETTNSSAVNSLGNVARFGITEWIEINSIQVYKSESIRTSGSSIIQSGFAAPSLGTRIDLFSESSLVPAVGMQGSIFFNSLSAAPQASVGWQVILIGSKALFESVRISVNLGLNRQNPQLDQLSMDYVFNLSSNLSSNWSTFVEVYGATGSRQQFFQDFGVAWLINPDLQLDLFMGTGVLRSQRQTFVSLGASFRFDLREKQNPTT